MITTDLDYLFRVDAPYIFVGEGEAERFRWIPIYFYLRPELEVCVRLFRGWKMRTTEGLMNEFSAALQFFDGFGENWYALRECLSYLDEWLPADAYVLVVERAEELLAEQSDDLSSFLKAVQRAAEFWSTAVTDNDRFNRPAIPFHVLLHISDGSAGSIRRFAVSAAEAVVPLRVAGGEAAS